MSKDNNLSDLIENPENPTKHKLLLFGFAGNEQNNKLRIENKPYFYNSRKLKSVLSGESTVNKATTDINKESEWEEAVIINNEQSSSDNVGLSSDVEFQPKKTYHAECKPCRKKFNHERNYFDHLGSVGHKKKMKPAQKVECDICEKVYVGKSTYESHLNGKYHKNKLEELELLKKFKFDKSILPTRKVREAQKGLVFILRCELCNKKFSGLISYDLHLKSRLHNMMVEKVTFGKRVSCAICKKTFPGPIAHKTHMSTLSHIRNTQRAKMSYYRNHSYNNKHPKSNIQKILNSRRW